MTSLYGPVVTGDDVRKAAIATIQAWAPTYTAEVERQTDVVLDPIRTYGSAAEPTNEMPACIVVCPGVVGQPDLRGDGSLDVTWALGVGIVVAHLERDVAMAQCYAYTAALRLLFLQQRALLGFARDLEWSSEDVTEIAWELDRSVWAGALEFTVLVRNAANRNSGPLNPPVDPTVPIDVTSVSTVGVTLTRIPLPQEL